MGLYEPKSCCICFDTKNGSLIIASLSLIIAGVSILGAVSGLLGVAIHGHLGRRVENHELDQLDMENFILGVCIFALVYHTISGICSSLLIHGIRKDRPALMLPYIILDRICITIWFLLSIYYTGFTIYLASGIGFIFGALPYILVTIIVISLHLVVNAYHNQVKRTVALSGGEVCSYSHKELINDDDLYKAKV